MRSMLPSPKGAQASGSRRRVGTFGYAKPQAGWTRKKVDAQSADHPPSTNTNLLGTPAISWRPVLLVNVWSGFHPELHLWVTTPFPSRGRLVGLDTWTRSGLEPDERTST